MTFILLCWMKVVDVLCTLGSTRFGKMKLHCFLQLQIVSLEKLT